MNDTLITSITVSGIAITVIFLVLTILIFSIKLLVHLLPYEAPPPAKPARKVQPTAPPSDADEDIAVITSAMTSHLSRTPGNLQIVNIQSR